MSEPKTTLELAREYLQEGAADDGAAVLLAEMIRETENWKRAYEIEVARREQAQASLDTVVDRLAFVSSCFGPPDIKGPDGTVYTLKDEIKLQHFEAVRKFLHKHLNQ
jgi:hypothetical protein